MFDLDTIHKRNQQAVDRNIRKRQRHLNDVRTTNPLRLLGALQAGIEIDLAVGRNQEVMEACERMTDIALRCAPIAFEAIVKKVREELK